jgi:TnpA family transposase
MKTAKGEDGSGESEDGDTTAQADTDAAGLSSALCKSELIEKYPSIRMFAPTLLETFEFRGASAVMDLLKGVEAVGEMYRTGNARHGNEPGVAFYTHISDQFGPSYTKVIAATASEAPHVLDGLLYHQTGLQIEEHYTDTGGSTDHVFGLCHLFGFRFAPRIRDLKDRRLCVFPDATQPHRLQPIIAGTINVEHIKAHREELLRMAVSIRSGTSTASAMLKRLSAYPRQNGPAVALREIGRIRRS